MFSFNLSLGLIQQMISRDHVVNYAALRDLLATELTLGAKVAPIIIAEMIVTRNREWLDSGIDEELCQYALELRLP